MMLHSHPNISHHISVFYPCAAYSLFQLVTAYFAFENHSLVLYSKTSDGRWGMMFC
nr:MAG TPA: hypothetical protein [Caudoviricetes sp.]